MVKNLIEYFHLGFFDKNNLYQEISFNAAVYLYFNYISTPNPNLT